MPPRRRRTAAWGVAGLTPVALGLAANFAGSPAVGGGAAADEMTTTGIVATTLAIPRLSLDEPFGEVSEEWEKPKPNKSKLGDCGWFGSPGADRGTNQRKNRTDLPSAYHAVTFDAVMDLDWPRDAGTRRDKWTQAQLAVIQPYEGAAVTVTGFVVALRPQAKNSESTNCGQTGEANTDWHVALVGEYGDAESEALVVEPTPRIKRRHAKWTPERLKPFVGTRDSVRFSGFLLLDPVHKNHLGKYRRTLWEIHPVHRIEVFTGGMWREMDELP
jgi:hypothetical protein